MIDSRDYVTIDTSILLRHSYNVQFNGQFRNR